MAAFVATGDGTSGNGNLTIAGSNVNANDVILAARNQVNLLNTTDTDSTRSANESKSASAGVIRCWKRRCVRSGQCGFV
jgi:filamentous hemagglutinin